MLKPVTLLFAMLLASCGLNDQNSSLSSVETVENYIITTEAEYDAMFDNDILPLFNSADTGYFTGKKDVSLSYSKFMNENAKGNVVIIHGFGENKIKYREVIYLFYQNGYNVFFYDQRGFGISDRLAEQPDVIHVDNFQYYADDLKTFMDEIVGDNGLPNFVFSHSMGGAVTTLFNQQNPEYFNASVLSGPMMDFDTSPYPKWLARALGLGAKLIGKGDEYAPGEGPTIPEEWIHNDSSGTSSAIRFNRYRNDLLDVYTDYVLMGGASWGWVEQAIKHTNKIVSKKFMKKYTTPTLLFQMENDTWVLPEGQDKFCDFVASCTKQFVAGARHEAWMEKDEFRTPYFVQILNYLDSQAQ